jgi:hypothetical protein
MNIQICTRSINEHLFNKAMGLITLPYQKYRLTGTTNDNYLVRVFLSDCDWLINVDEDCYIIDNMAVQDLLDYMVENDYDYCGMPEAGISACRMANNPLVMNPFFNIFNIKSIQSKLDPIGIVHSEFGEDLLDKLPHHLMKNKDYGFGFCENYYRVFYWLLRNFKPLWLDGRNLDDEITTELFNHNGKPMCWHTWYAREYGKDDYHTVRIDKIIKEAYARCRNG